MWDISLGFWKIKWGDTDAKYKWQDGSFSWLLSKCGLPSFCMVYSMVWLTHAIQNHFHKTKTAQELFLMNWAFNVSSTPCWGLNATCRLLRSSERKVTGERVFRYESRSFLNWDGMTPVKLVRMRGAMLISLSMSTCSTGVEGRQKSIRPKYKSSKTIQAITIPETHSCRWSQVKVVLAMSNSNSPVLWYTLPQQLNMQTYEVCS